MSNFFRRFDFAYLSQPASLASHVRLGYRRFFIAVTTGTTIYGSIDSVEQTSNMITTLRRELYTTADPVAFYLHVDASFGGMTIPFVLPELPIGFQNPEVCSIAIDPDKMGQLPYPAGIFLARRSADVFSYTFHKVEYVGQGTDNTVLGSRPGWIPAMAYCLWRMRGVNGQKRMVQNCIELTNYLEEKLIRELGEQAIIMPRSEAAKLAVNVLPVAFPFLPNDVIKGKSRDEIMKSAWDDFQKNYQLRFGFYRENPSAPCSPLLYICKFLMMPHITKNHIDYFINDLKKLQQCF